MVREMEKEGQQNDKCMEEKNHQDWQREPSNITLEFMEIKRRV